MNRERQHSHALAHATKDVGPDTAAEVEGWPGKQSLTMDLGWPGPESRAGDQRELVADAAERHLAEVDTVGVEAIDHGVAAMTRNPAARSDADDQELWIAQQQRPARWKQVVGWADEHRARRASR